MIRLEGYRRSDGCHHHDRCKEQTMIWRRIAVVDGYDDGNGGGGGWDCRVASYGRPTLWSLVSTKMCLWWVRVRTLLRWHPITTNTLQKTRTTKKNLKNMRKKWSSWINIGNFYKKSFFSRKADGEKKSIHRSIFFFSPIFNESFFRLRSFFLVFFASTSIQTLLPLLNKILFWLSRARFLRFPPFSLSLSLSLSNICSTSLLLTHLCSISIHTHTVVPSYSLPTQNSCLTLSRSFSGFRSRCISLAPFSLSHTHSFFSK